MKMKIHIIKLMIYFMFVLFMKKNVNYVTIQLIILMNL